MENAKQDNIVVSICCTTYNHEKFIRDAIEGFLMQETDFPVEIIIHDDASTDSTPAIIREYADKHPDQILPIFQSENQHSRGKTIFGNFVYPRARGKYVATCEGDDYWTSPYKLQRQVEYMEANPDCLLCCHPCAMIWEDRPDMAPQVIEPNPDEVEGLQFGTFLYRKSGPLPKWFHDLRASSEWPLVTWVLMQGGRIGSVAGEPMSVYRKHQGGVSTMYPQVHRGLDMLRDHRLVTSQLTPHQRKHIFCSPLYLIHLYLCRAYVSEGDLSKARSHLHRYIVHHRRPRSWKEISKVLKMALQCYLPTVYLALRKRHRRRKTKSARV